MTFLSQLNWRFATKKFDPAKKITDENLHKILEAIRMAPTSLGLQPIHVIIVTNEELKEKLTEKSYNQPQIKDCSHLLVFCARTDSLKRIDDYVDVASKGIPEVKAQMKGLEDMMRKTVSAVPPERLELWAQKQTYLALGFAMAACAELQIDSCPMEGFLPKEYDKLLNLPEHIKSAVILPIGYRTEDPKYPKFRFPEEELFETR